MSLLFGGNTFAVVQMWYPLKVKISSDFVHARKYYYSIYDTFGTFQTEAPAAPAADAKPSCEAVSLPEAQNQDNTALALPDQRQLKLISLANSLFRNCVSRCARCAWVTG